MSKPLPTESPPVRSRLKCFITRTRKNCASKLARLKRFYGSYERCTHTRHEPLRLKRFSTTNKLTTKLLKPEVSLHTALQRPTTSKPLGLKRFLAEDEHRKQYRLEKFFSYAEIQTSHEPCFADCISNKNKVSFYIRTVKCQARWSLAVQAYIDREQATHFASEEKEKHTDDSKSLQARLIKQRTDERMESKDSKEATDSETQGGGQCSWQGK